MPYHLIAVNGGRVCQRRDDQVKTDTAERTDKAQQWEIEGSVNGEVAFRNLANGEYLNAEKGDAAGKVKVGPRQTWKLEKGYAPNSVWIKSVEFEDKKACLCNSYANHTKDNVVYMWPQQDAWEHSMLWYIRDVNECGADPLMLLHVQ
ncbi:hypothetical protein KC332_g5161 [Hortaea werneckii]|uniref:Ricin B lectin domain-containing protein n=2 Tax=Hortaea werneckii TaxID=91943 RepID=A0A3M7HD24_HORWE|nr:hypothetical protein KC358_g4996 [Hortaea werneckii]OTA38498.1 hypothetical protein BTJ68_01721 [Hortaea werneckii EXF-2000]KAI6845974.1 hypothetical protein KC350_g4144 [Hortaea werneckii]KAI6938609.1 hypothetical protein KC341_g4800 [Hortaea werneckii]KAI6939801.1 hypothetical protein KC348_g5202 [Hortaea werneckii]